MHDFSLENDHTTIVDRIVMGKYEDSWRSLADMFQHLFFFTWFLALLFGLVNQFKRLILPRKHGKTLCFALVMLVKQ